MREMGPVALGVEQGEGVEDDSYFGECVFVVMVG